MGHPVNSGKQQQAWLPCKSAKQLNAYYLQGAIKEVWGFKATLFVDIEQIYLGLIDRLIHFLSSILKNQDRTTMFERKNKTCFNKTWGLNHVSANIRYSSLFRGFQLVDSQKTTNTLWGIEITELREKVQASLLAYLKGT